MACVLCGDLDEVETALIAWRSGSPFGSGPRCVNREACWARCVDQGEEWPVDDGRPASRPKPEPAVPVTVPAKEINSWFD